MSSRSLICPPTPQRNQPGFPRPGRQRQPARYGDPFSVNANYAISFNGLSQAHNIWIIDGGEAYDRGSGGKCPSCLLRTRSASSRCCQQLSSDYGIASGGTITMSLKSGTSKFHGEAWGFDRNDALDAHNYFDNNTGQHAAKAELRL